MERSALETGLPGCSPDLPNSTRGQRRTLRPPEKPEGRPADQPRVRRRLRPPPGLQRGGRHLVTPRLGLDLKRRRGGARVTGWSPRPCPVGGCVKKVSSSDDIAAPVVPDPPRGVVPSSSARWSCRACRRDSERRSCAACLAPFKKTRPVRAMTLTSHADRILWRQLQSDPGHGRCGRTAGRAAR